MIKAELEGAGFMRLIFLRPAWLSSLTTKLLCTMSPRMQAFFLLCASFKLVFIALRTPKQNPELFAMFIFIKIFYHNFLENKIFLDIMILIWYLYTGRGDIWILQLNICCGQWHVVKMAALPCPGYDVKLPTTIIKKLI